MVWWGPVAGADFGHSPRRRAFAGAQPGSAFRGNGETDGGAGRGELARRSQLFPSSRYAGGGRSVSRCEDLGPQSAAARNPELRIDVDIHGPAFTEAVPEFALFPLEGVPFLDETLLYHRPTQTLLGADVVLQADENDHWSWRLAARITGCFNRVRVPPDVRKKVADKQAASRSLQALQTLPIRRLIVAHGSVIEEAPLAQLREAWRDGRGGGVIQMSMTTSPVGREQQISRLPRRAVERVRVVVDRSRDQAALAGVADAGPARPADRDVAGLGQLQQALVRRGSSGRRSRCARRTPADRCRRRGRADAAARRRRADDTRGQRRAAGEELHVNPGRRHAEARRAPPSCRP